MKTILATCSALIALCIILPLQAADHAFGWKPEPPGTKALYYHTQPQFRSTKLKAASDLRPLLPAAWDQGQYGACTAFGNAAGWVRCYYITNGKAAPLPSFAGLYDDERIKDGTWPQDAGSYISTGAWVLENIGIGTDKTWPYTTGRLTMKPSAAYYKEAAGYKAVKSYKIDSGTSASRHLGIITALSNDLPVVFGGFVYADIETLTKSNYWEAMPKGRALGGHCRAIVGHNDTLSHTYADGKTYTGFYIVRNSWSPQWGLSGHSFIPYAFIDSLKYCDDFRVYPSAAKPAKAKR